MTPLKHRKRETRQTALKIAGKRPRQAAGATFGCTLSSAVPVRALLLCKLAAILEEISKTVSVRGKIFCIPAISKRQGNFDVSFRPHRRTGPPDGDIAILTTTEANR
ncbi:hypothetical protein [Herbaspirillum robiniae]|uniref:hypothetical protein n=1 Tax=Herbaspirillum robiniae TaxID=2014887 RepID=UPI003D78062E